MVGKSEKEGGDGERGQRHPAAARDAVLVGSPCQEATQRAAQTRGLASRPAPCPKLRAPYPELQKLRVPCPQGTIGVPPLDPLLEC